MNAEKTTSKQVETLLREQGIMTVDQIAKACNCSRNTIFLKLQAIDHMTSYNHNKRFMALTEQIQFGADGLGTLKEARFSKWGGVKNTLQVIIKRSKSGLTTGQINERLQVRTNRQLGELVKAGKLVRKREGRHQYYFSADPTIRDRQLRSAEQKWKEDEQKHKHSQSIPNEIVITVLATMVREQETDPRIVQQILRKDGIRVQIQVLKRIIANYDLKKT